MMVQELTASLREWNGESVIWSCISLERIRYSQDDWWGEGGRKRF